MPYLALHGKDGEKLYTGECPSTFRPAIGTAIGAFLAEPLSDVISSVADRKGKPLPRLAKIGIFVGVTALGYVIGKMLSDVAS